jgi:HEAT repeat protein
MRRLDSVVSDASLEDCVALLADEHRAVHVFKRLVAAGADALPALRRGLRSPDPRVRAKCCQVLDHLAEQASFALLASMLADPHPRVRIDALHALACDRCKSDACRPGAEDVLPQAIALLRDDPNKYVRAMAAELVGRWVHLDEQAKQALLAARNSDCEASVRKKAGWYAPGGPIFKRTAPRQPRVVR